MAGIERPAMEIQAWWFRDLYYRCSQNGTQNNRRTDQYIDSLVIK